MSNMRTALYNKKRDEAARFDLYGGLEDAYDEAELEGKAEIVETLDALLLWNDRKRMGTEFMRKVWRAIRGNAEAQSEVAGHFYVTGDERDDLPEEEKWRDRPELAQYWYDQAADRGNALAQYNLGCLLCPDLGPREVFKLGRFTRQRWEEAAEQKLPIGMRALAHCLRCGKCPCCDVDIPRAEALEAEAETLDGKKVEDF